MDEKKEKFRLAFEKLPGDRQRELEVFYDTPYFCLAVIKLAKDNAQSVIEYADRRGYGYGEVGYNLNEEVKEFAEDVPELAKEYGSLLRGYFNLLTETKLA